MADLSLQDVKTLVEWNNQQSELRHQDMKQEMREGFSHLSQRVEALEQEDKPLITFKTVKWAAGVAAAAMITVWASGFITA